MDKDNFEGTVRSAVGQGEKILGQATNDRSTTAQGYYDDAAGKARSAVGSAKDAVSGGVDAISSLDFSGLRDEISKLIRRSLISHKIRWRQGEIKLLARWARQVRACHSLLQMRRTNSQRLRAT